MSTINIQFETTNNGATSVLAEWEHNRFNDAPTVISTPAQLKDDTGTLLSQNLSISGGVFNETSSGTLPVAPFPASFNDVTLVRSAWLTTNGGTTTYTIDGYDANQEVTVSVIGWNTNNRSSDFTVNGSAVQVYDVGTGNLTTVPDELTFVANADGSGNVNITVTKSATATSAFYGYMSAIKLVASEAADTVTPTETDYTFGDSISFTTTLTSLTGATLTDSEGNTLSLTSVTDTSASIPALVAGLDGILIENDVVLEVTDGTLTASVAVNFVPPTGYLLTTLASVLPYAVESDWTYGFDTPAVIGDQSIENASFVTHNDDGTSTITGSGTYTYYVIDATDGVVSEVVKTVASVSEGIPSIDRTTWNAVGAYLRTQGYTGGNNDVIMEWLSDQGFEGAYNDRWDGYWDSLGYTGGHNDKRTQWVKS